MKTALIVAALLLPAGVLAQTPKNMNQGDMQNMMQVMQQVQECMASIDQGKLEELQATSEKLTREINSLCGQGQRDKAQTLALSYGRKMASDPTLTQMQKCGEMAQGVMPMMDSFKTYDEKEYASRHVCDD